MRQRGFTLLELMVTLAVAAIIVTVGIPGMRQLIQNNRAATSANNLVSAMQMARSEALKRGSNVTVCASSDGATCTGTWPQGWIVATDTATANNAPSIGTVLQVWEGLSSGSQLTEGSGETFVRYFPSGLASGARSFSLQIPDCSGDHGRNVNVSVTGRVSTEATACQ